MTINVFDPTTSPQKKAINYVSRPQNLEGLKIGLVDNSKFNSKTLLIKISEWLKTRYNMEVGHLNTKLSPGHPVAEAAIRKFKSRVDFVIAGIGD